MRSFGFTAKNMGEERYLTYVMGEGCELDEDTLDIVEDGVPAAGRGVCVAAEQYP